MKREVNIPVLLMEKLGEKKLKRFCREYINKRNTKPLDDEIHSAQVHLACLLDLRKQLKNQLSEFYREQLIKANKEYGNIEPYYPDDCQEFNVPNMN